MSSEMTGIYCVIHRQHINTVRHKALCLHVIARFTDTARVY